MTTYKDNITIDDVNSGETIRTKNGQYFLVIKMGRSRPRFIEINPENYQHVLPDDIEAVFSIRGSARILPTEKEV